MQRLTDWTARRAGATITIEGRDEKGDPLKVRVEQIVAGDPYPIAAGTDGRNFELMPS